MKITVLLLDDSIRLTIEQMRLHGVEVTSIEALPFPRYSLKLPWRVDQSVRIEMHTNPEDTPTAELLASWLGSVNIASAVYDLILVDDQWDGGSEEAMAGQENLLPLLFRKAPKSRFCLFTEHSKDAHRMDKFVERFDHGFSGGSQVLVLGKDDRIGLRMLFSTLIRDRTEPDAISEGGLREKAFTSPDTHRPSSMIGESSAMRNLYKRIYNIAKVEGTVLLLGETGTGKELAARAIHEQSKRSGSPLIIVNCANLSSGDMFENQLFGHDQGSFTGAEKAVAGLLETIDGGTIFFDEIGDMSPIVQAKVLRILESNEFARIGGTKQRHSNVRVIAATNKELGLLIRQGNFREDLYYRLDVHVLVVPSLRDRRDDIPLLVQHFVEKLSEGHCSVSKEALQVLCASQWPGNVRQLENCIKGAVALAEGNTITTACLPSAIFAPKQILFVGPDPHTAIEVKKRLDIVLQLSRESNVAVTSEMIDKRMNNKRGAFKAYCHDNGSQMALFVKANLREYGSIVAILRRLSPSNFSGLAAPE